MGEIKGFLKYKRQKVKYRSVEERVHDYRELELTLSPHQIHEQAARCMDCGIPFCHGAGCPLKNRVPEFNELLYNGRWEQACEILHMTNNFPEITGRICPAPCESACTLSINDEAVLIRHIEFQIAERGFAEGWIKPKPATKKTGRRVAIVGSGPAGLAAGQQLVRAGHEVVIFEKGERPGGLLRYGIPDFKLEKSVIDRRLQQLVAEGVEFQTGVNVGKDISADYLKKMFGCVCLAMGAGAARDLKVCGRECQNVIFAMDYLTGQNKICCGEVASCSDMVTADGKKVVVIGGGDTGSDCVGTARRQGASEIYQLEILPKPPEDRPVDTPWPMWPRIMRTSAAHEEGCERRWAVMTKKLVGENGQVRKLHGCNVEWSQQGGRWKMKEIGGSDFTIDVGLVILATGFLHVEHNGLVKDLGLELDERGNVVSTNYQTSVPWVFAAGDTVSGASLVVRAIDSGRSAAAAIDSWLTGEK